MINVVWDMKRNLLNNFISLDVKESIWDFFYTVAPLVIIGSKENNSFNLAPKHMATPIGFSNYFGFVCTPRHSTYHNIKKEKKFTVSFVKPSQVLFTSLSATPRDKNNKNSKEILKSIPTIPTTNNNNLFIADSYVLFECSLYKIIDGFDDYSIITGKIDTALVHKDYKIYSEIDEQKHIFNNPLLVYIAQGRFANVKNTYNFPFPKDFQKWISLEFNNEKTNCFANYQLFKR